MILAMLVQLGGLFFVAGAMCAAVHLLSRPGNLRRSRATFGTMVMVTFLMGAFLTVVRGLGYLGLPVLLSGYILYAGVHLYVYGAYFGLGPWRALWMGPIKWLAILAFDHLSRIVIGP